MGCSISDYLIPENRSSLTWAVCQRCRRRKDCPYFCGREYSETLRCAACQGRATARRLTAEAERLLEAISRADDAHDLLSADETLERTLSNLLRTQIALIESFSVS